MIDAKNLKRLADAARQRRRRAENKDKELLRDKARRKTPQGRASQRRRQEKYRSANRDKIRAASKKTRELHPARLLFNRAKIRAKRQGREFSITLADIDVPEFCPVLGLRLEFGVGSPKPNSPSLDRIDSALGYVKGNVRVISFRANTIKTDASVGEVAALYEFLIDHISHARRPQPGRGDANDVEGPSESD